MDQHINYMRQRRESMNSLHYIGMCMDAYYARKQREEKERLGICVCNKPKCNECHPEGCKCMRCDHKCGPIMTVIDENGNESSDFLSDGKYIPDSVFIKDNTMDFLNVKKIDPIKEYEQDIEIVMQQARVSRECAINALKENNGDIVDAMMNFPINDDDRLFQ